MTVERNAYILSKPDLKLAKALPGVMVHTRQRLNGAATGWNINVQSMPKDDNLEIQLELSQDFCQK